MNPPRYPFLDNPGPIAFAHRGGAAEAPENSWESFRHAVDLGYRYIETDVHATRDGIVLTIHDPDLARTADRPGLVRDLRWEALAGVRLRGSDEGPPRLAEVLAAWPDVRWNIDAKHDSVVGPLIETIHRSGALERVCVTSFNDRRLATLQRAFGGRLCTAMGPAGITLLRAASVVAGLRSLGPPRSLRPFAAAQVPMRQYGVPVVDARFVAAAHSYGFAVHVWTIDDEAVMDAVLDLGVDGVMTDRPSLLREVMRRRGQWA